MSTRASLMADSTGTLSEIGEAVSWIPLLWVALLSEDDFADFEDQDDEDSEADLDDTTLITDLEDAMKRCRSAVPFLVEIFPEFTKLEAMAKEFIDLLEGSNANNVGIQCHDHIEMNPGVFLPALNVAASAIESKKTNARFKVPASRYKDPFSGKVTEEKSRKLTTTRDVVCFAASLDPATSIKDAGEQEELQRDQLLGYLFLENFSQKKSKRSRKGQ